MQGFAKIHETMGEDSQLFARLWERIWEESRDFGTGFARIRKDLEGFVRLWTEDLQGLWKKICKDS